MKKKQRKVDPEHVRSWEKAAAAFEDGKQSVKLMKASRVLSNTERRRLFGPGKTKQISVRLPEEDLAAVKEIAEASSRPYQQLVVIAVQQYLDRVADTFEQHKN